MTDGWRLAARNLRRNRRRNLATGLAVALGCAGLALLGGYLARVEAFLRTSAVYLQHSGHVVVYHADGLDKGMARPLRYSLTPAQQTAVRAAAGADPRIAYVAAYLKGMGLAGNGCRSVPFVALGVEAEALQRNPSHPDVRKFTEDLARPVRGRPLSESAAVDGRVSVAAGLAALLGKTRVLSDFTGPPPLVPIRECTGPDAAATFASDAGIQLAGIAFDGSVTAMDGDIVSIFHTPSTDTEDVMLQTSLSTLQHLYDTEAVTYMAIYLRDWRDADRVASDLRARLSAAGVPADVRSFTDERVSPFYVGSMAFIQSMAGFIVLIVTAVVVLGVMNATTLTVYERSRELGTMRALGFSRAQVSGLVVREVGLLASLGVVSGWMLAHAVAAAVRMAGVRINPPGVPGSMLVILTPPIDASLWIAALLVPLSVCVAWVVVRRRVRERTSDLLIAVNA